MKKIIAILCLFVCLLSTNAVNAVASLQVVINGNVEGYIGTTIDEQTVTLTLESPYTVKFENIDQYDDVTGWFTNIPSDLYAEILEIVSPECIKVQFYGDLDGGLSVATIPIEVTIPAGYVNNNDETYPSDLSLCDNTNANYILKEEALEVAYKKDYTVSGTVGEVLTSQDVVVKINHLPSSISFNKNSIPFDLPVVNGLTPTVSSYDETELEITITYTGTPLATSQDLIHTTFSKESFPGSGNDVVVPDRIDVKFNIVDLTPAPDPTPVPVPVPVVEDDEEPIVIAYEIPKTGVN